MCYRNLVSRNLKRWRRYAHLSKPQLLQHAELVSNVFIDTNLAHPKKKEIRETRQPIDFMKDLPVSEPVTKGL